ncbi:hypothetical protein [Candidatus Galacturonibacter soehngenii]|uniref:Pilus assembly protein n=1 Tax=Candidatus Galacturonatibacter soehngenii TaxID=2307010 RepID=A0A7V7UC04_9FIRM|nr:hypothetical protein [Candidatus Galacturonibacter soehngenii]KAB1438633.1 hypothetical protein F7O84_13980 [Candidatus Galacturonibacter soehngenii]MBA4685662.1 hypothetical protein [Candidatus Galacturonibacter soehngenii]
MPFQNHKNTNYNQTYNSLHTLHILSSPNDKKSTKTERVSSFISQKASLTVEAAMVLPIFIFAICFMMYFTEIVKIQAEVGNELYKQSKDLALYAYVYERAQSNDIIASGQVENLVSGMLSSLYVKSKITNELGENYFEINHVEGGISLLLSSYMQEEDMIDVVGIYSIKIPFQFFQIDKVRVIQRARIRAWTGYDASNGSDTEEEMVYITQYGSVYHVDISCTHINLSVSQIRETQVSNLRNDSGGKYYECELCGDEQGDGSLFITNTGDRYHKRRDCSGIRRGIIAIPISQIEGRQRCQRCGN